MQQIIDKIARNGFKDLAGSQLDLKLPLPEDLLNEFIHESVREVEPLEAIRLFISENNELRIRITVSIRLVIKTKLTRTLVVKLSDYIQTDDQYHTVAKILEIEGGIGRPEKMLLKWLSSMINDTLPHFTRFEEDKIQLNVYQLLAEKGYASFSEYIKNIQLKTDSSTGKLWVSSQLNITN